jgi:uncharacterized membrane protein
MIEKMRPHTISATLGGLAAIGAAISGYLTYVHMTDRPVICGGQASCATVQSSEYASIGGVPIALLGLLFYLVIAALALAAVVRSGALLALFGLALGGVLYSAYLTWVEVAVLEAICFWCVASALVVGLIAVVSGAVVLRLSEPSTPAARPRRRVPG